MAAKTNWLKIVILCVFIGGLVLFFALGGNQYLTLDTIRSNRDALLHFSEQNYLLALVSAILVYTLATALSIPGATVLSLIVGFLFGRWIGTGVILFSATLGATLVFLAARYLFAEAARKKMGPTAQKMLDGFKSDGFHYMLFLRLVPLFPFWLVNLVPAFTAIPLRTYFVATAIGILPGCFVFANLGQSLGRIESMNQLVSTETLLAFGLLGVFALIPVMIKKFRSNTRTIEETEDSD